MTWTPIGLTDPFTKGPDVSEAQRLLDHNPFGDFYRGSVDGEFGPITAAATRHAKYFLGYRSKGIIPIFGARLHGFLSGSRKLPIAYRLRRKRRLAAAKNHPTIREVMVKWCRWGIANEPRISYGQIRPILFPPAGTLPLDTDCSGSTILFAKWSAVPPRDGLEYDGAGSSGDMGTHLRRISRSAIQPGDLVCWPFHHVAVILTVESDPEVETHGQERGPMSIRLSDEAAFHKGEGHGDPIFLSLL